MGTKLRPAAAYYRVSSKSQDLALQRHAVERAARARGDRISSAAVYAEKRSAKTTDRPELQRLLENARAGCLAPRLYVYRLDRLTRSGIRDTLDVVEQLRRCGVELVTVADGFDPSGPAAEVILAVMAWAARMERLAGEERRADARERRAAQGLPFGRPPKVPAGDPRLARAELLQAQGRSLREIAQRTGIKRSTLARKLSQKSRAKRDPAARGKQPPDPPPGA